MPRIRSLQAVALGLVALGAVGISSASAQGTPTITITHQMRGCHTWNLNDGPGRASLTVTLRAGTTVKFVNDDVMPHKLIQTGGPRLVMARPALKKMTATTSVRFVKKGTYRLTTQFGDFFPWAASMRTPGPMYVLRLTVHVK